jgi:hypothetical protein
VKNVFEGSFYYYYYYYFTGSWVSSVNIAMNFSGRSRFDSRERKENYFALHSVQTGSGAYQASYPTGSNSASLGRGVKQSYRL